MNSRERVLTSIAHQEPDRVPTALWGGPYGPVDDLYFRLLERLDLGEPVDTFRRGHTINYLDDRVLEALNTDTRYVWPGANPTSPRFPTEDPRIYKDSFGQPWIQTLPYYSAGEGLLQDVDSAAAIQEEVSWPDPDDPEWTRGVAARTGELVEAGEHFIIGRMVTSHGPFQLSSDLRGMAEFLLDLAVRPDFARSLLARVTDTLCGLLEGYLKASAGGLDLIELPGDDYATNENLIFSPEMFREFIKPSIARMVETIRGVQPEILIMLHSDGAVGDLIPDFIELGIDVLHPLEPVPGLDVKQIKREYGRDLTFLGGIDITKAMPGTVEDVRADVDRCLETLAPGGGYILAPSNHLQEDVPAENVVELYTYAQEAGRY